MADLQRDVAPRPDDGQHREIRELLPWYLNQTLEPGERNRVEDHLRACSSCQREFEELQGLQKALTVEAATFSEALFEGTLQRIRARGGHSAPAARERMERWAAWRGLLRPRLALSLSVFALVFLGLGVFLGLQFGTAIAPGPGQRAGHLTEQYFAFPRTIELQGTLTMMIGDRSLEQESFTLERLEDGKELFTSNIQASELAATQRLQLAQDLRPLSYSLQGPLVYRGIRAEANFTDGQATLSVCCTTSGSGGQEISRRIVQLDEFPVLYDFSVMSHFALLHRVLTERLARGASLEELKFSALTPQALRVEPLWVESLQPATLLSQGKTLHVTRYRLAIGQPGNPLRIDLYAPEHEELIAVHIPVQPRLASSAAIFAYRSDLYPQGLEVPP
jgi:hypothetical protein